jgi:hypothetical protein
MQRKTWQEELKEAALLFLKEEEKKLLNRKELQTKKSA